MKLVMFEAHQQERLGALQGDIIIDLGRAHDLFHTELREDARPPEIFPRTMIDFLEPGEDIKEYVSALITHTRVLVAESPNEARRSVLWDMHDVRVLPPVARPPKIVCVGLNYRDHAEETQVPIPDRPILFSKPSTAIIGPDDSIIYPKISTQVDHEVELGVIIGKRGKDVPESEAFDHVAGYTVFNDISARDIQFADKQWFRGKSFDTFAPTGPCLVLKDQLGDPHHLKMELRVNGETRQNSTTANMVFGIPQLVAFISKVMTIQSGDIIATGTPAGVGFYAKPEKKLLKPGDLVEAEIEGLGILRNRVVGAK